MAVTETVAQTTHMIAKVSNSGVDRIEKSMGLLSGRQITALCERLDEGEGKSWKLDSKRESLYQKRGIVYQKRGLLYSKWWMFADGNGAITNTELMKIGMVLEEQVSKNHGLCSENDKTFY